jgi:hypothetical protein
MKKNSGFKKSSAACPNTLMALLAIPPEALLSTSNIINGKPLSWLSQESNINFGTIDLNLELFLDAIIQCFTEAYKSSNDLLSGGKLMGGHASILP